MLAAYALGATLWAPSLVLIAGQFEGAFARFIPGLSVRGRGAHVRGGVGCCASRSTSSAPRAAADYGYGVNGVIVNRQWTLAEKAQRIARDWFGVLLVVVWIGFMAVALVVAMIGR